jgi:hypothetical protein
MRNKQNDSLNHFGMQSNNAEAKRHRFEGVVFAGWRCRPKGKGYLALGRDTTLKAYGDVSGLTLLANPA